MVLIHNVAWNIRCQEKAHKIEGNLANGAWQTLQIFAYARNYDAIARRDHGRAEEH